MGGNKWRLLILRLVEIAQRNCGHPADRTVRNLSRLPDKMLVPDLVTHPIIPIFAIAIFVHRHIPDIDTRYTMHKISDVRVDDFISTHILCRYM